ncbi:MAG: ABC transporter ATP-binding protein [Chloroflexota bacterium]|nr:ABC transporter ATP-binding protein [Chloroflexota bacterium]
MFLSLKNLVKIFPPRGGSTEVLAVNDISLEITKGEMVTLLGPSGCGKTTTLRLIAGFEFPTQGSISLDGQRINELPPHQRNMSMVFQSYAIFPHLNVFENIAYGLNVQHLAQSEIKRRVGKVMALVELEGLEKRAPNQLSGGQQQRVALSRALVMEPKVLLMDEPLSNLDAKLREQMRTEIRRIQQTLGITSVYVTHDQIEAMTLSDRVVIMNHGIIEQVAPPQEVYRYPRSRFVADFIGRANFVTGVVKGIEKGILSLEALGQRLHVPQEEERYALDRPITLVVRPEMVRLHEQGGTYTATVRQAAYLGDRIDYQVEIEGQLLDVVESDPTRSARIYPAGTKVGASFYESCIHLLPGE